jgi:hypothetical protein
MEGVGISEMANATERQRNQAAAGGDVDQEPDLQPATEAESHHSEASQRATLQ